MSEVKNYDIRTLSKIISTTNTGFGIGIVPTGMKRWVTFIRADNVYGGENKLIFASVTGNAAASNLTLISAAAKERITLQAKEHFADPPRGPSDPQFPLFSIAEGKYLQAKTNRGQANIFLQYFDTQHG